MQKKVKRNPFYFLAVNPRQDVYEHYVNWCEKLGIEPASKEKYWQVNQ